MEASFSCRQKLLPYKPASLDTMRHSGPYLPFLSSIEATYPAGATLTMFETPAYDVSASAEMSSTFLTIHGPFGSF